MVRTSDIKKMHLSLYVLTCVAVVSIPAISVKGMHLLGPKRVARHAVRGFQLLPTLNPQHLQNATRMSCSDALGVPFARMVQLTDNQLRDLFEDKGGNYVREYMAVTEEEARTNFPNLLLIPMVTPTKENHSITSAQNQFSKETILQDLAKLVSVLKNTTNLPTTVNKVANTSSSPSGVGSTQYTSFEQVTNRITSEKVLITDQMMTTDQSSSTAKIQNATEQMHTEIITESLANYMETTTDSQKFSNTGRSTTGSSVLASSSTSLAPDPQPKTSVASSRPKSTLDPEVQHSIDQLLEFVQGSHSINYELLDMAMKARTSLPPSTLINLSLGNQRTKRNADASVSQENYCLSKGSLTDDRRYAHLCTTCAATTTLPEGYFPRYINEVICKTGDTGCFSIAGTVHGQCQQRSFQLKLLRRRPSQCMVVLHDGDTLVIDDWYLEHRSIKASCECAINKNSVFRQYVAPAPPIG